MATGVIRNVNDKQFGFIRPHGTKGEQDAFFHAKDLAKGLEFGPALRELEVEFELSNGPRGWRATAVKSVRP